MIEVPIFKLDFEAEFVEKFKDGAEEILSSGAPIAEGKYVKKFEARFAQLVNATHAISATSGTAALELALRALDIEGGVAMPNNTFSATAIAAINSGHIPVLIDSEPMSINLCIKDLERKIVEKNIKCLVLVHIGGLIQGNIREIKRLCDHHGVVIVEDAAHAHLSSTSEFSAGTIGDVGCFSFFPTKVMTTGEGGMVTTNDDFLAEKMRSLKNFGRDLIDANIIERKNGINSKISEFSGLLGFLECDRVSARVEKRNQLMERYIDNLSHLGVVPFVQDDGFCAYYKCIVKLSQSDIREDLRHKVRSRGVTLTGEVYKIPLSMQPGLRGLMVADGVSNSQQFCSRHICPPLYPELSLEEIDFICEVLEENKSALMLSR